MVKVFCPSYAGAPEEQRLNIYSVHTTMLDFFILNYFETYKRQQDTHVVGSFQSSTAHKN